MLRGIQQVLRLIMLLGKQRYGRGLKPSGGLLVLIWTEPEASAQSVNCTVAAAGRWCIGIQMEALQPVLTALKESMFPSALQCPQPDPEELWAFTDLHGSLQILLSFKIKHARPLSTVWCAQIEVFLHTFSLANAGISIHLKFKLSQQNFEREFRAKISRQVSWANQQSLLLDVTSSKQPPECVRKGCWCYGGHPVPGGQLPLSIPPPAMNQGLFGELSVQPVTVLSPCVLQYPNLPTQLTHIRLLLFSPSNVPVTGPSTFFQNLPAHLDCETLGLHGLHCSSIKDLVHSVCTVYTVEHEHCKDQEPESSPPPIQQSLLLFLFLQHSDPFTQLPSDIMASEALMEHHLEDILNNNQQAVTAAMETELRNTLRAQDHRKKGHEKLCSASEVILSSCISIVSSSSNMGFRNTCLNIMKVCDTHDLSASLRESLMRVTSWKRIPRSTCHPAEMELHPAANGPTRAEI